jgi:hypothetical protein
MINPQSTVSQSRVKEPPVPTTAHTLHLGITLIHFAAALAALVMTIVVAVYSLGEKCNTDSCQPMLYITSTFLSSRRLEANSGWAVPTQRTLFNSDDVKRDQNALAEIGTGPTYTGYAFTHFYECMHSAKMADAACLYPDSFSDYYKCMTNTSSPVKTALQACNIFPTISSKYTHFMTSEDYISCIGSQPLLKNSVSVRASRNVFRACLAKSQWPFFENQLDVDTSVFLGSYNWALFLTAGLAVMTSFAVYSASWLEDGPVRYGQPEYFMRLGLFWTFLSWLWNLAFFVIFILIAFRETGAFESNGGLPTTVSTTLATLGIFAVTLLYFGNELFVPGQWTFLAHPLRGAGRSFEVVHKIVKHYHHHKDGYHQQAEMDPARKNLLSADLGLPMPNPSAPEYKIDDHTVARYYTPPLLATWADGYIADALIFLGMAGATQQLTNDQAWNIAVLITAYRLLNMMIASFMYECFMNNLSLEPDVNAKKFQTRAVFWDRDSASHNDPHLSTRVMALSTQIAALYLYIGVLFLVFNGNVVLSDVKIFRDFVICCFVVPEILRMLLHLYCQFWTYGTKSSSWLILNTSMLVWTWDVVCRVVFISIVVLQTDKTYQGTREYLIQQSNTILRDFIAVFVF